MSRLVPILFVALAAALGACGVDADTRPHTATYIQQAILEPSCGRETCHSTALKLEGFAFDTRDGFLEAATELVYTGTVPVGESKADRSKLYQVLVGAKDPQMPPDGPLTADDIDLIAAWINDGAQAN
ncbi:MAG: hypothetical protein K8W52_00735 [Deltaproteobacteria bacterium]|nr:hypothetical protein [Deltaproteobacteria bacterium]